MFKDTPIEKIDEAMQKAWKAFDQYRKLSLKQRAVFMRAIAKALENSDGTFIETAMQETNLPEARLKNERGRTLFQLTRYAEACTGLEVCLSMQHGGPFPATTDSRFTSVGADGIKRSARLLAFQNWANDLLPDDLKNENPFGLFRTVNTVITKDAISQ